jgi:ADP-ribose pyrophosphatase YjhB (NUDIX family)
VLVREFRSPASTPDGFVHELPGGSGAQKAEALDQAVRETEEETGLAIDAQRLRMHGSRQLAATVSAHHAHLFAAEITDDEFAWLRTTLSAPHGASDGEQTWTEITTFGEIREGRLVDWATLGMIAEAVLDRSALLPRMER